MRVANLVPKSLSKPVAIAEKSLYCPETLEARIQIS